MWLFLLSEAMLFGALLSSYFMMRLGSADCALGSPAWPAPAQTGGLTLAALNTLVLITSSYTMVRAVSAAKRSDSGGLASNLGLTLGLGAAFLAIKAAEYAVKIRHGYFPGGEMFASSPGLSIFLSFYFALTGLHALHVAAGVGLNLLLYRAARRAVSPALERKVEYAGLYWHFVDLVWMYIFPLFYLV